MNLSVEPVKRKVSFSPAYATRLRENRLFTMQTKLHDLVNVVSVCYLAFSQQNALQAQNQSLQEYLGSAVKNLKFGLGIVESGQQKMRFDPRDELNGIAGLFASRLRNLGVKLQLEVGSAQITGRKIDFWRIAYNLVTNALDAFERHKGKYLAENRENSLKLTGRVEKDDYVLSVSDNAFGILPEVAQKLLSEPVSAKYDPSNYENRSAFALHGNGLLQVKKSVSENFFGRIQVKSVYNVGTTVILKLPIKPSKTKNEP